MSYGADVGLLSAGDTIGLRWLPHNPAERAAALPQLKPLSKAPGCYSMQVRLCLHLASCIQPCQDEH